MVHGFLDAIVERSNVSTKQLINTPIFFSLDLEKVTNTSIRILVFFHHLNNPNGTGTHHPVNGKRVRLRLTWADQGFTNHGVTCFTKLTIHHAIGLVAKGGMGACSPCDSS